MLEWGEKKGMLRVVWEGDAKRGREGMLRVGREKGGMLRGERKRDAR